MHTHIYPYRVITATMAKVGRFMAVPVPSLDDAVLAPCRTCGLGA